MPVLDGVSMMLAWLCREQDSSHGLRSLETAPLRQAWPAILALLPSRAHTKICRSAAPCAYVHFHSKLPMKNVTLPPIVRSCDPGRQHDAGRSRRKSSALKSIESGGDELEPHDLSYGA